MSTSESPQGLDTSHDDILRQRARELARPADPERDGRFEVLGFVASGQRYLVPLTDLVEVVPGSPLARVPHAPAPLLGVATLRSSLLAVFGLGRAVADRATPPWMLVLGAGRDRMAVAVDELTGIHQLDPGSLHGAEHDESDPAPVTALHRDGAGLLDVELLLARERFTVAPDTPSDPGSDRP